MNFSQCRRKIFLSVFQNCFNFLLIIGFYHIRLVVSNSSATPSVEIVGYLVLDAKQVYFALFTALKKFFKSILSGVNALHPHNLVVHVVTFCIAIL